jgi:penicillin-binding protein 2
MIFNFFKKNKIKNRNNFVEPDEIFLDSENLQNFDQQQFAGRIEMPLKKNVAFIIGLVFSLVLFLFSFRLGYLQIVRGEEYRSISERNTLKRDFIFSDRGIIFDRNGKELAWNVKNPDWDFAKREYFTPGFSHVLGYVSYPAKDNSGRYWQQHFIGKDGLEKQYNDFMTGENGAKVVEVDVFGNIQSENTLNPPKMGQDLFTTIDRDIQNKLFVLIEEFAKENSYIGGSAIFMDIDNGEIIASVSFPEYDSNVISDGSNREAISGYLTDKRKVFLNRPISGLYTPGSIVKPFFALGALDLGIISPDKKIYSSGQIEIPNPYFPDQKTIFRDWKAHGWTNVREAIAVSSDVYFYAIGGGYADQKGMGIANLEKYARLFNIGQKTNVDLPGEVEGVIPNPEWKAKNFQGEPWRLGNTYHTSIGQYGFQVTPLEMTRATATLANYGKVVTPHFLLNEKETKENTYYIDLNKKNVNIVLDGMRQTVTEGTASILNVPYVGIAGKTGTAELGVRKDRINSWIVGFFPYENPKYTFTFLMESGPSKTGGASILARRFFDWMNENKAEYFK